MASTASSPVYPTNLCVCCRKMFVGFGNNPAPLILGEAVCCDDCNKVVVFIRISLAHQPHTTLNRRNWLKAIRRDDPKIADIKAMFP